MKFNKLSVVLLSMLLTIGFFASVYAEGEGDKNKNTQNKITLGSPVRTYLDINDILTVIKNDGISDIDVNEQNSGLVYPKGSGKTAVFTSGFLWGAQIAGDPQVRVGGTAYRTGLEPGKITNSGLPWEQLTAEDPNAPNVRIYRVRRDVFPGGPTVDLSGDALLEASSESALRDQYELDWNEWPASDGAPYEDVDSNGVYDPTVDIPGFPGSDQTIWFVANDLNSGKTTNLYGTVPLGIEMQATFWAYAQTGALGSMYFREYKIINKSNTPFDSMYVSMWSDVDLGNSTDDFAGSDTTLSLGYSYNANANDPTYNPLPPPAVGFDFFQGPEVNGEYLPMTAFYYFARGDQNVTDPTQGDPQGATQFYNFFQGRVGKTGELFVDPNTGEQTTFALAGDPQLGTGWLDGQILPAGDRRMGMASGPFTMEPGDTQVVVVAEIVAGAIPGVDRLSAVGLLKFYDKFAQVAYDNNFELPVPADRPDVSVVELDQKIVLNWGSNTERVQSTESFDSKGFEFQGYNVYQLPSASANVSQGVRIATYDIIDGVGKIDDEVFDANTGSVVTIPVQFGNDTGIKRYLEITQDALNQRPLINGIRYYFAVTSYTYNDDPTAVPNNLENPIQIITVVPQSNNPGITFDEHGSQVEFTHQGTADGGPVIKVVDPTELTGHTYEVFFSERQEIRNEQGNWVPASVVRKFGPDTLTGSSIDISGIYGVTSDAYELSFSLDLVSSNGAWADGITLVFPPEITIIDAPSFEAGGGTVVPEVNGNVVTMGIVDDTSLTQNGIFHGGETWSFIVSQFTPPASVDWEVHDDGWDGGPLNETGTTTITEIGYAQRLAKYWNLRDVTTGELKLENVSIINGVDIYPDRDDIITNLGNEAAPIVDGFQIYMTASYSAPLTISQATINGASLTPNGGAGVPGTNWTGDDWNITDFTYFGYPDGTAETSLPLYGGIGGTTDINLLQQDYEFRWTGVLADTMVNGNTLEITQSGGSLATIFGASGYDIADHPMNPNPGSSDPFTVRVPFEVWNKDNSQQVNLIFWDRSGDPTVDSGKVWNTDNRVYGWIVNTPYAGSLIDINSQEVKDNATWQIVYYLSTFTTGDIIELLYDNPVQIGTDTYTFDTDALAYSDDLARNEIDEINVFPNPYYGVNSEELNKYNRFVTFSHLPEKATIRIFNLAGVLVKTIEKTDAGQFQRWDLANESGLPVASGLYLAYIEMPDLGETKILKVAIIQEQQILDRF